MDVRWLEATATDTQTENGKSLTMQAINSGEKLEQVKSEIAKVVVGQQSLIDRLLLAILCDGHVLLEGVPGIAKTLTINSLAKAVDAQFSRIHSVHA